MPPSLWDELRRWLSVVLFGGAERPRHRGRSSSRRDRTTVKKAPRSQRRVSSRVQNGRARSVSSRTKKNGGSQQRTKQTVSRSRRSRKQSPAVGRNKKRQTRARQASRFPCASHATDRPPGKPIGRVTHYFDRIRVVVIDLEQAGLRRGDRLAFVKNERVIHQQPATSLQVESVDVKQAKKGQRVGMKVDRPVAVGSDVWRVPKP